MSTCFREKLLIYSLIHSVIFHATLTFFFFNDTATTEIYTLSLHDALPIYMPSDTNNLGPRIGFAWDVFGDGKTAVRGDRKSTRLNSSHQIISYAVFCLKKKNIDRSRVCSFIGACVDGMTDFVVSPCFPAPV